MQIRMGEEKGKLGGPSGLEPENELPMPTGFEAADELPAPPLYKEIMDKTVADAGKLMLPAAPYDRVKDPEVRQILKDSADAELQVLQRLGKTQSDLAKAQRANAGAMEELEIADRLQVRTRTKLVQAEKDATIDALTGLKNKAVFGVAIQNILDREARNGADGQNMPKKWLVILDMDHFKEVNDKFGHLAGDAVLRQLGQLLQEVKRGGESPFRIGGEEFAVFIDAKDERAVRGFCRRLLKAVEGHKFVLPDGTIIRRTISAGFAAIPRTQPSAQTVIFAADEALYRAKKLGRNRAEMGVVT